MKLNPSAVIRLWREGHDTLAIAEALVGPERAPKAEGKVYALVAAHKARLDELRVREDAALLVSARRSALRALRPGDIGIVPVRCGGVTLARVAMGEGL